MLNVFCDSLRMGFVQIHILISINQKAPSTRRRHSNLKLSASYSKYLYKNMSVDPFEKKVSSGDWDEVRRGACFQPPQMLVFLCAATIHDVTLTNFPTNDYIELQGPTYSAALKGVKEWVQTFDSYNGFEAKMRSIDSIDIERKEFILGVLDRYLTSLKENCMLGPPGESVLDYFDDKRIGKCGNQAHCNLAKYVLKMLQ